MDEKSYKLFTQKIPPKKKSRTRPLPKASDKYLEAFDRLKEILDRMEIKYEEYFHFKSTKHWRFDLHLVGYLTLIEIAGGPWSGGRGGRKIANAFNKYDLAEDMGYRIERLEPHQIESGYAINWIRRQLERLEDGTVQTIPTVGSD